MRTALAQPQARQATRPSFEELTRCTWGTHVTVCGQAARFNQAGVLDGRQVVVVVAHGANPVLHERSWHTEPAGFDDNVYYVEFGETALEIGTPPGAPLMPQQACAWLRREDLLLVNAIPVIFSALEQRQEDCWLTVRSTPNHDADMLRLGSERLGIADSLSDWRVHWHGDLLVRLITDRLLPFEEIRAMERGMPVTVRSQGMLGRLQGTCELDGTKRFVLIRAPAGLALAQADHVPVPRSADWIYRIRYEEAGLRVANMPEAHIL